LNEGAEELVTLLGSVCLDDDPGTTFGPLPRRCVTIWPPPSPHHHPYHPYRNNPEPLSNWELAVRWWQLFQESLQCLVITDHDPGTLERARDSHETTLEELYERATSEEEKMDIINETSSIPADFEALEWGHDLTHLKEVVMEHIDPTTFDMILGSDLIYCWDVVEPLFLSASQLMSDDATFFLSQSFVYDEETEDKIDKMCNKLHLERVIVVDKLSSSEGTRIQTFRRKAAGRKRE
jgi:hypothetical protein